MDSLTHIALGACLGEAFAGKTVGKKAMLWGILAQSAPDVDFFASLWMSTTENLLAHRGFCHSILFALLLTPGLALVAEKWHRPHNISLKKWILFFAATIGIHLFLDGFNNYGVGWLEPFTHQRFSFNTLYVADPFFSFFSGLAFIVLLLLRTKHRARTFWWRMGIGMTFLYIGYSTINKIRIDNEVKEIFEKQHIPHTSYFTTPAPFQNLLWFVVAGDSNGYFVGYRSLLDNNKNIDFHFFPRNENFIKPIKEREDVKRLKLFSQGFYTIEKYHDTLVFNDLRFGQVTGWHDPMEKFSFHYYLSYPDENKLVVQRGRFENWNSATFKTFLKRVSGN